ncbi:hypothetical protein QJS66_20625 [Kocuria rhizophila]|nr:hypothetical protein QJS66_20625 [Kocuria rhizophila]
MIAEEGDEAVREFANHVFCIRGAHASCTAGAPLGSLSGNS